MIIDRRQFIGATTTAFAALVTACGGNGGSTSAIPAPTPTPTPPPAPPPTPRPVGYGPLLSDPAFLLDLPQGFSYQILSSRGDVMTDGARVPDNADGMGCLILPSGQLALVRNHELGPGQDSGGAIGAAYDAAPGGASLPGGTTTLVLNAQTLAVERQYRSLIGTIRNCAGGVTPWGSWLSCEEDTTLPGSSATKDHGWIFEVPATATGPVNPVPLRAMGRFRHEAACVDPATGIVYMTEDRDDSLLYRFVPNQPGVLAAGGTLQALAVAQGGRTDSRNFATNDFVPGVWTDIRWLDLANPESPSDDLRIRGLALGALRFARGEGIFMGAREFYFTCTSGGAAGLGQIFRVDLAAATNRLQLFFESTSASQLAAGDNIVIAPDGQLLVCEDQGTSPVDNFVRGFTSAGTSYPLARLRTQSETAGACFSPDGRVLFLNIYSPAKTLAIIGPWQHLAR